MTRRARAIAPQMSSRLHAVTRTRGAAFKRALEPDFSTKYHVNNLPMLLIQ
jgi:hypothetical protein